MILKKIPKEVLLLIIITAVFFILQKSDDEAIVVKEDKQLYSRSSLKTKILDYFNIKQNIKFLTL